MVTCDNLSIFTLHACYNVQLSPSSIEHRSAWIVEATTSYLTDSNATCLIDNKRGIVFEQYCMYVLCLVIMFLQQLRNLGNTCFFNAALQVSFYYEHTSMHVKL